jgi:hypothetical protein
MPKENKNQNGKRTTEMKLTGKKDRKLSKKKPKTNIPQKFTKETSQKENLTNWSFTGTSE